MMKVSKVTGQYISMEINRVKDELKELSHAVDVIEEGIGTGTVPHRLMKEQYEKKRNEWNELNKREYTI